MTVELTDRFRQALDYAFQLHACQLRKGTRVPYMSHLMSVSALVLEQDGDEDEAIAALLHDAVEDQGGAETLRAIHERFGERVAHIVSGCSDTDQFPKPPWQQRKQAYLAHLETADPSVLRVSLADKIHNARDILIAYQRFGPEIWGRFRGGREGTLWYYQQLVSVFRRRRNDAFVAELERVVREMESLAANEDRSTAA